MDVALCHQIQVRGKPRITDRHGELSLERLSEIEDCLLREIGLP
jgi:mRNA-degrading endonuclease toxin of MazEF toxin-antitoxin module